MARAQTLQKLDDLSDGLERLRMQLRDLPGEAGEDYGVRSLPARKSEMPQNDESKPWSTVLRTICTTSLTVLKH